MFTNSKPTPKNQPHQFTVTQQQKQQEQDSMDYVDLIDDDAAQEGKTSKVNTLGKQETCFQTLNQKYTSNSQPPLQSKLISTAIKSSVPQRSPKQDQYQTSKQGQPGSLMDQSSVIYGQIFRELTAVGRAQSPMSGRTSPGLFGKQQSPTELKRMFLLKSSPDRQKQLKELNSQTASRLLEYGAKVQQKKEVRREDTYNSETVGCTFKPKVNKSRSPSRRTEEFIKDQEDFLKTKNQKLQEYQAYQDTSIQLSMTQNSLSKGSLKLIKNVDRYKDGRQSPLETSSHLYQLGADKLGKMTKEQQEIRKYLEGKSNGGEQRKLMSAQSLRDLKEVSEDESYFRPQINKMSKNLVRTESVGDLLYKKAQNKLEQRRLSSQNSYKGLSMSLLSESKSNSYIVQTLTSDLEAAILDISNNLQSPEDYYQVFKKLGMANELSQDQAIKLIRDSLLDQILTKYPHQLQYNLLVVICAIMTINMSNTKKASIKDQVKFAIMEQTNNDEHEYLAKSNTPSHTNNRVAKILSKLMDSNTQQLSLSDTDVNIIHHYFILMYVSRVNHLTQLKLSKKQYSPTKHKFVPNLNSHSMKIAAKILDQSLDAPDRLLSKGKEYQERVRLEQSQKLKNETKDCSFKPQVSPKSKQLLQDSSNYLQQSQKVQETFNSLYQDAKIRQKLKTEKSTEQYEYEKSAAELTFQPNIHRQVSPKSKGMFKQSPQKANMPIEAPIFMVNIELDDGFFQLNICKGDKVEDVVRYFCQQKQLSDRMQRKILRCVQDQMKTPPQLNQTQNANQGNTTEQIQSSN